MPSEPNTPRSANALADLAMKYVGDVPTRVREFNEGLPTAAVDAGRAIFSKLPPELQKGLSDAASTGGDALHQMVTHVASSPVGQAIGAGLQGIDIATEPLQQNYDASQQMMKDMGVQAPSMVDNPLFDVADVGPLGNADQALMAFHGSPNRFRMFDASHIGSGEGAQAFGYGMYFAENPAVAREYVKAGEGSGRLIDAAKGNVIDINTLPLSDKAKRELAGDIYTGSTVPEVLKSARRNAEMSRFWDMQDVRKGLPATREEFASEMDALADLLETGRYTHGVDMRNASLYKVDVPDEYIPKMLDWNKQLYKQPEIQKELEDIALDLYGDSPHMKGITPKQYVRRHMHNGDELYTVLSQKLGSDKAASAYLNERGIPGIKYFDGSSRGKGKGTRNFVVFPGYEDKVKMLERNDIPFDSSDFAKGGPVKGYAKGDLVGSIHDMVEKYNTPPPMQMELLRVRSILNR